MTYRNLSPWLFASVLGAASPAFAQEDLADVPSEDRTVGDDEHMRFFLIGADTAAAEEEHEERAPRKLLLVLPGGDGSAEFNPFVRRIWKYVLEEEQPGEWVIAQLVAPKWSEKQAESLVWPTKKNPWPKMGFTTEEFVDGVIGDVESQLAVDPDFVFTLSWSSSGPAAYAVSLAEDTKVTGSFVAMSVFKPDQLPALKAAEGHAYYLLHSPKDFIPIRMAREAEEALREAKATVELVEYEGGHGWRGDVFGMMRTGVAWLTEHHATGPERRRKSKKR